MKDIVTPVAPEEVRGVIKKCLENAALVNYTRVSEYAKIEGLSLLPDHCLVSAMHRVLRLNFWEYLHERSKVECNVDRLWKNMDSIK